MVPRSMGRLWWEARVLGTRLRLHAKYALLSPFYYRNPLAMFTVNARRSPTILRMRDGTLMKARPGTSDRAAINEVFVQSPYTADERFQLHREDVVVDAGANIGAFTVFAARRCKRVLAIEPLPGNFQMLRENIRLNQLDNVAVVEAALAAEAGELNMHGDGVSASTFWGTGSQLVPSITLESCLTAHAIDRTDLLKMDIEGGEFDVLMNCPAAVLSRIRRIALEVHPLARDTKDTAALARFLRAAGFEVWHTAGGWNALLTAWR